MKALFYFLLILATALAADAKLVYQAQTANDTGTEISNFYPEAGLTAIVWGEFGTTDGSTLKIQVNTGTPFWLTLDELTFTAESLVHVPLPPGLKYRTVLSGVDADTSLYLDLRDTQAPYTSLTVTADAQDTSGFVLRADSTPVLRPGGLRQVVRP